MNPAIARVQASAWTVRSGEVRVTCPLTVGGSFTAKTTAITGEYHLPESPSELGRGAFIVDLTTLDTGIELRNQHMRETYLEVGKGEAFSRAALSHIRLNGLDASAPSGRGSFSALLRLHGVEREVTGQAELRPSGAGVRVRASFGVSGAEFGIAPARYLGVGVKDQVTVQVTFESTVAEGTR